MEEKLGKKKQKISTGNRILVFGPKDY